MAASTAPAPDYLPTLSPGRHRSPKRGACFMEYASFLAGERWTDHPACTSPVLGAIARGVNDFVSAQTRALLPPLVPRVIGLTSDDPRLALRLALRAAADALPIASMERQHALAVGIRQVREELNRLGDTALDSVADDALAFVPLADAWSRHFCANVSRRRAPSERSCEAIATVAVLGIADACVPDADLRLHRLLLDTIDEAERFLATRTPSARRSREPQPAPAL